MVNFPKAIATILQIIITIATVGLHSRVLGTTASKVEEIKEFSPSICKRLLNLVEFYSMHFLLTHVNQLEGVCINS